MPETRITYKYSSTGFEGVIKYTTYVSGADFYVESVMDTTDDTLSSLLPISVDSVYSYGHFITTAVDHNLTLDIDYPSTETLIRVVYGNGGKIDGEYDPTEYEITEYY